MLSLSRPKNYKKRKNAEQNREIIRKDQRRKNEENKEKKGYEKE